MLQNEFHGESEVLFEIFCEADENFNGFLDAGEEQRYFIDNDFTIEPFTERFDNAVTGWVMSFAITVENELNSCNIPIDNTTICVK